MLEAIIMKQVLKEVDCSPECGFMIRSHDENELKTATMAHVKNIHHMTITEKDAVEKMRVVS